MQQAFDLWHAERALHDELGMIPAHKERLVVGEGAPLPTPNPAVEVREFLADGTEFKAVWGHRG